MSNFHTVELNIPVPVTRTPSMSGGKTEISEFG